jgi:hypothetical protein
MRETLKMPCGELSLGDGMVHSPPNPYSFLGSPCTLCSCLYIDDELLQPGPDPDMLNDSIPGQHTSSAFAGSHSYWPCYPSEMLLEKE